MAKTSEIVYIHSPGSYPSGGLTGLASESSGGLDLPEDNGMRTMSTLAGIIACSAVVGGISAQEQTGSMKFKAIKNFNFIMPKEAVWTPTTGGIAVKHPGGDSFRAAKDGVRMSVDTNADGEFDSVVKGSKGYLKFISKSGGEKFQYAARFKGGNGKYDFASSCAMVGSVAGVPLQLFDLNNNGSFNELGEDAIIVGKGKAATYLSKVISHKGKLYNLNVSENSKTVTASPYDGQAGKLNLASEFRSKGKLEAALASDGNGNTFNVAGHSSGLLVPVGEYTIIGGFVKKGSQTVRIHTGKMSPLKVSADATNKLRWGGPLAVVFTHTLANGEVTVDPKDLHYYGKAGEEYCNWAPNAKSPKFVVRNTVTGKDEGGFIFEGC
jgi:hypothetical protein